MGDRPAARRRGNARDARDARRGTLVDSLPRMPATPDAPSSAGRSGAHAKYLNRHAPDARGYDSGDVETPGRLTLPSMPRATARRPAVGRQASSAPRDPWDDTATYARGYAPASPISPYGPADYTGADEQDAEYDEHGAYDAYGDVAPYQTRARARSLARPLTPALPQYNDPDDALVPIYPPLPIESAPDLAAFRPARAPRRARLDTRALVAHAARSPWTKVRLALALAAMLLAFMHAPGRMGEQAQPLMTAHAQAGLAPGSAITSLVRPETQLLRPDLYDSYAQFQNWGGAACSAAALSEVLTAYGVPHATIGHEIDELGSYISPNGGLLNRHGFAVVAAKHNLRADESTSLTYNQIVYLSAQLGMPVIVNVRISYGYYHFFDGGHFLTVVGGDAQGLQIVDSSEYYIHYLPKDVFYQMFTGYTAAIVPMDYQYTLPAN